MKRPVCSWCGVFLSWRSRLRIEIFPCHMCASCHRHGCCEAGIYLQNGGPEFRRLSRSGQSERRGTLIT